MADMKVSQLDSIASLSDDDLLYVVDSPMGVPASKKVSVGNLLAHLNVPTAQLVDNAVTNDKLANMTRGTIKVGGTSNEPTDMDAKGDGYILVGDGTDIKSVLSSGDVIINSDGSSDLARVVDSSKCRVVADTYGGVPIVYRLEINDGSGNYDAIMADKCYVIDAWAIKSGGTGNSGDKIKLVNVNDGASDMTEDMEVGGKDYQVVRFATLYNRLLYADDPLRVVAVQSSDVTCTVYAMVLNTL